MKNILTPLVDKPLLLKRSLIETLIGRIKLLNKFEHSRHRSATNAFSHMLACLINYQVARYKTIYKIFARIRRHSCFYLIRNWGYLQDVSEMKDRKQAQRVGNNILKCFQMMWLFVENPEIEPTNNFAERQIKHHVKYRKSLFFTWSERGDRFLERSKSIFATSRLQNLNLFIQISSLL